MKNPYLPKSTYEKLEGQLEMDFRPPRENLYAAMYGSRQRQLTAEFLHQFSGLITRDFWGSITGRMIMPGPDLQRLPRAPMTATEAAGRARDLARERLYGPGYFEHTRPQIISGHRADLLILDDIAA